MPRASWTVSSVGNVYKWSHLPLQLSSFLLLLRSEPVPYSMSESEISLCCYHITSKKTNWHLVTDGAVDGLDVKTSNNPDYQHSVRIQLFHDTADGDRMVVCGRLEWIALEGFSS